MVLDSVTHLTSPLSQQQLKQLTGLTSMLTPVQQAWISGYLAAQANFNQSSHTRASNDVVNAQHSETVTVLYGSQTGNGRGVAEQAAEQLTQKGLAVNLVSMADYSVRKLKNESLLVVVVSTHGEGETPDDAITLYQYLNSKRAPKLDNLKFSVLALGDSSYEHFCQTGKDFQQRFIALGATELQPIVECDVDFQALVDKWQQQLSETLIDLMPSGAEIVPLPVQANEQANSQTASFTKQQPLEAEVIISQKITGRDSGKDVRHVEIDLGDANLAYQPGDALGVWAENSELLVDELLNNLQLNGEVILDEGKSLKQILMQDKELTILTANVVKRWAELADNEALNHLVDDTIQLREYVTGHQFIELVQAFPANITAQELVALLRGLTPRLYSIASSQDEVENEVHLTVAKIAETRKGVTRYGTASKCLSEAQEGNKLRVFVESNPHFKLPENPQTDVIMIGPGTGIAPFRAFIQQRAVDEANGKSWLFFGNPHVEQDFLYQTEIQQWLKQGQLTQIDLAFSRDQAEKIYIQHRLAEQGEQVWQWLQSGAHLYVCGDAKNMAKDVHQTLIDIAIQYGGFDEQQAEDYFNQLRSDKRYQKDVY
ncbi:assimilatory sulfite reductase (NADPH) flavoprotein subunit [Parashewanella spongiae]|uniref:Sulfite reductase [NADPH] flavoprotein alpha-component n=1 Tax=Parashewanella spongiae TaxID=342950 RepID=A0A3A6TVN9_9GAMM|nr:assimilatory sulfite reductase (NADPH) flavoprotein subunit [Parashewanella spongiae]MCL1077431.1 assimilatory sulfite reductase (NADPH) flavoprotein subunit [Parashewanella spongiae]RJY18374.1 assimilatory sulfite reductase (NADPH) flavoprotein subunit [Parashewanella spongiae]